jgi:hypothetical protein
MTMPPLTINAPPISRAGEGGRPKTSQEMTCARTKKKTIRFPEVVQNSMPVRLRYVHQLLCLRLSLAPRPPEFYGFFSLMLLPNMNPISAMALGWFWFAPVGPNPKPGV